MHVYLCSLNTIKHAKYEYKMSPLKWNWYIMHLSGMSWHLKTRNFKFWTCNAFELPCSSQCEWFKSVWISCFVIRPHSRNFNLCDLFSEISYSPLYVHLKWLKGFPELQLNDVPRIYEDTCKRCVQSNQNLYCILQYCWRSFSYYLSLRSLFCLFWVAVLHRVYCMPSRLVLSCSDSNFPLLFFTIFEQKF